jgi:hypothetical protein
MLDKNDVLKEVQLKEFTPSELYLSTLPNIRQEEECKVMTDQMQHNIAISMWDDQV